MPTLQGWAGMIRCSKRARTHCCCHYSSSRIHCWAAVRVSQAISRQHLHCVLFFCLGKMHTGACLLCAACWRCARDSTLLLAAPASGEQAVLCFVVLCGLLLGLDVCLHGPPPHNRVWWFCTCEGSCCRSPLLVCSFLLSCVGCCAGEKRCMEKLHMNSKSTLKTQLNFLVPALGSWVLYAGSEGLLLSFAPSPSPFSPALLLVDGVHCTWVSKGCWARRDYFCVLKMRGTALCLVPCLPTPHNVHQAWA